MSDRERLRELEAEVEKLKRLIRELWDEWAVIVEKLDELEDALTQVEGRCSG